ncbi:MAG: hypothetical protein AB1938_19865 [Myxococcota bacterium]
MLSALLLALTLAAPRCTPEGVYRAEAGFFTTFDGKGRWATSGADLSPIIQGPVYREGDRMRFKLDGDGETVFPWFASFSDDCASFVLKYEKGGGQPEIRFRRVKSPSASRGLRGDRSRPPAGR